MRAHTKELHRSEQEFLKTLRPFGDGFDRESLPHYLDRMEVILPHVPESILEQWFYRDPRGIYDYAWLGVQHLAFRLETWPTERLIESVDTHWSDDLIDKHAARLLEEIDVQRSWLGQRVILDGTWPVPPIILDNIEGLARPDGLALGRPYHFVEGHHRFGYFRALRTGRWHLAPDHLIWIMSPTPEAVMQFWPMNDLNLHE